MQIHSDRFLLHCISIMLHSFVGDYRPVILKKLYLIELCYLENTQSEHDYFCKIDLFFILCILMHA